MTDFTKNLDREKQTEKTANRRNVREAKEIREHFTEGDIDKILKDTFPASDPPAWY